MDKGSRPRERNLNLLYDNRASKIFTQRTLQHKHRYIIMKSRKQCIKRLVPTGRLVVKNQQKALNQSNFVKAT